MRRAGQRTHVNAPPGPVPLVGRAATQQRVDPAVAPMSPMPGGSIVTGEAGASAKSLAHVQRDELVRTRHKQLLTYLQGLGRNNELKLEVGDVFAFNPATTTVTYPAHELTDLPIEALFGRIIHEAGHVVWSASKMDAELLKTPGLNFLFQGIEDVRINGLQRRCLSSARIFFKHLYEEFQGKFEARLGRHTAGETKFMKSLQFLFGLTYLEGKMVAAGAEPSGLGADDQVFDRLVVETPFDPEVKMALNMAKPFIGLATAPPDVPAGSDLRTHRFSREEVDAQAAFSLSVIKKDLWPILKDLMRLDGQQPEEPEEKQQEAAAADQDLAESLPGGEQQADEAQQSSSGDQGNQAEGEQQAQPDGAQSNGQNAGSDDAQANANQQASNEAGGAQQDASSADADGSDGAEQAGGSGDGGDGAQQTSSGGANGETAEGQPSSGSPGAESNGTPSPGSKSGDQGEAQQASGSSGGESGGAQQASGSPTENQSGAQQASGSPAENQSGAQQASGADRGAETGAPEASDGSQAGERSDAQAASDGNEKAESAASGEDQAAAAKSDEGSVPSAGGDDASAEQGKEGAGAAADQAAGKDDAGPGLNKENDGGSAEAQEAAKAFSDWLDQHLDRLSQQSGPAIGQDSQADQSDAAGAREPTNTEDASAQTQPAAGSEIGEAEDGQDGVVTGQMRPSADDGDVDGDAEGTVAVASDDLGDEQGEGAASATGTGASNGAGGSTGEANQVHDQTDFDLREELAALEANRPDGGDTRTYYESIRQQVEPWVDEAVSLLKSLPLFEAMLNKRWETGYRTGKRIHRKRYMQRRLEARALASHQQRSGPNGQSRAREALAAGELSAVQQRLRAPPPLKHDYMMRPVNPQDPKVTFVLASDISGSMSGNLPSVHQAQVFFSLLAEKLNLEYGEFAFETETVTIREPARASKVPMDAAERSEALALTKAGGGGTDDLGCLRRVEEILDKSQSIVKIPIFFTDGEGEARMGAEVKRLEREKGIPTVAIAYGPVAKQICDERYTYTKALPSGSNAMAHLPRALFELFGHDLMAYFSQRPA